MKHGNGSNYFKPLEKNQKNLWKSDVF
jgi:hypothetical protein